MGIQPPEKDAPPSPDNYWRHINFCKHCSAFHPGCAEGYRLKGEKMDMDPKGPGLPTRIPG